MWMHIVEKKPEMYALKIRKFSEYEVENIIKEIKEFIKETTDE